MLRLKPGVKPIYPFMNKSETKETTLYFRYPAGKRIVALLMLTIFYLTAAAQQNIKRKTISLNGMWAIAEGSMSKTPSLFLHKVPVPGLVTLATPAFANVGPKANYPPTATNLERSKLIKDTLREAFWYKRNFRLETEVPAVAVLRIAKAMFGAKAILNGVDLGEHLPSFTSGYFDVQQALKKGDNELLIRVGADRGALPRSMPDGFDYEKDRYIPGIYDKVEIILSGTPHIVSVQVAPDIRTANIKVQVALEGIGGMNNTTLQFVVSERISKRIVATLVKDVILSATNKANIFTVSVPIKDSRLWSPEEPFLYNLQVSTATDEYSCRFGMREFYMDTVTKQARLNGKPYFMRGSNVTLLRFFEDEACGSLPWNAEWVRNLHKSFKKFHWNSLRYCIGFPPEEWYNIADEEGFLIQDEFPVWYGGKNWSVWPKELAADELVRQYTEWMHDHWNHPCVAIWDAGNETYSATEETAKAVQQVRHLDLSNRPWDNGYSTLREAGDIHESHPYHFQNPSFKLKDIPGQPVRPQGNEFLNDGSHAVIINEYGWLWLNRDGSPTTLTRNLYHNLLGNGASADERRHVYAMYLSAETEFWRCHRQVAGVLHFTALGYSRDSGQTSDHFLNVAQLQYEPQFLKYMPDAFSPVGLMLDEWGKSLTGGRLHEFSILAINDLQTDWRGPVEIRIVKADKILVKNRSPVYIPAYGATKLILPCTVPDAKGIYIVEAVLEMTKGKFVKSIREIPVE